jgi:hypothetical protein
LADDTLSPAETEAEYRLGTASVADPYRLLEALREAIGEALSIPIWQAAERVGNRVATFAGQQAEDWQPKLRNAQAVGRGAALAESEARAALLRAIIGNPFSERTRIAPEILAWSDGAVPSVGRTIYRLNPMSIGVLPPSRIGALADALEDADCTDAEILDHPGGPRPHVRGCWALDLILAKS